MKTLVDLQEENRFITDKNSQHSYLEVYDKLFSSIKEKEINFFELGIHKGGSMLLWNAYFTKARLFCLDKKENVYRDDLLPLEDKGIITMIMDYDLVTKDTFCGLRFDVVIDDLSHDLIHQIKTFNLFRNKLRSGGMIVIEDIRPENLEYWKYISSDIPNSRIIDRRHIKNRYDDVLFIYNEI